MKTSYKDIIDGKDMSHFLGGKKKSNKSGFKRER